MKISSGNWPAISALLDQAMELPPERWPAWLDALPPEHRPLRAALQAMLADMAKDGATVAFKAPAGAFATTTLAPGVAAGQRIGPYRLQRELGRGGMGSVWAAERDDGSYRRSVALKLPHAWSDRPGLVERLARERDILATLEHPHIARLYDAGFGDQGHPYLAMQLVDGGVPITEHADAQRLDLQARVRLLLQVADAVQYAHQRLVLHRDLKPSNILVTPAGEAVLLDFGIAKLMPEGVAVQTIITRQGERLRTPDYASPEQIAGEPLTTASDVWALGRVLYQLLVGRRPFVVKHETAAAIEGAILGAEPVPPSRAAFDDAAAAQRGATVAQLRKRLTGDLDAIVLKALAKKPAERYPGASALAADLRRWLAGEPVSARPDTRWRALRRVARRRAWALAIGGVALVAVSAGLAVALQQVAAARGEAARWAAEARRAQVLLDALAPATGAVSTQQALQRADEALAALGDRRSLQFAQLRLRQAALLRAQGASGLGEARVRVLDALAAFAHEPAAPGHADAWRLLAAIETELGHPAEADEALRRAQQLQPGISGSTS